MRRVEVMQEKIEERRGWGRVGGTLVTRCGYLEHPHATHGHRGDQENGNLRVAQLQIGLTHDLQWLSELLPEVPPGWVTDLTEPIDRWQADSRPSWKSLLRRAWRVHLFQEQYMLRVHQSHEEIFRVLQQHGGQFSPDPLARPSTTKDYRCDCGKSFTTGQGLACHKRLMHGVHAPERAFTSQATCQHCLRFFWTTRRLHQHLSYIPRSGKPNPCFAALQAANAVVSYEVVKLPPGLRGHCRFDALQCEGPTVPLVPWQHHEIEEVQRAIALIEEQLRFEVPPDHLAQGLRLGDALAALTRSWFRGGSAQATFRERQALLGDAWTSFLADFDETFQEWVGFLFLEWGSHYLPDIVAELIDGEAEQVILDEFYDIAQGLPRVHLEQRLSRLQGRLRLLQAPPAPAVPHRPIYWGPANDSERHRALSVVPRLLREQQLWQTELRRVTWMDFPPGQPFPLVTIGDEASPMFLLVHLFAGRRRHADFHDYVLQFAEQWNIPVCVLSLDTAIAPHLGDLRASSETWLRLLEAFDNQLISGTLLGSPCETFSQARYNPPPNDGSATKKWPRPLRDALHIFGLDRLTLREYRQAAQGHDFVLQGLRTLAAHISGGGLFCSEHPAIPEDRAKASIWTMALTELLRAHPDAQLLTFAQYRWGAETVKPTCLLAYNAPKAKQHLYKHADWDLPVPEKIAIGKNDSNTFCTAALKEYPPRLCAGLAEIFIQRLRQAWVQGNTATIAQSDLVGFTTLASSREPMEVVRIISELFDKFDDLADQYRIYKVETVGDAYIAGQADNPLTSCNQPLLVVLFGIQMTMVTRTWSAQKGENISCRVGVHTGECVGGMVGESMQRYHLFGDLMRRLEILEATAPTGQVQVSRACKHAVETQIQRHPQEVADVMEHVFFQLRAEQVLTSSKGEVHDYSEVGGPTYLARPAPKSLLGGWLAAWVLTLGVEELEQLVATRVPLKHREIIRLHHLWTPK
eukprot:Skav206366  [mRNA]  locus=scaffold3448:418944:430540:- [translate_table: standard]